MPQLNHKKCCDKKYAYWVVCAGVFFQAFWNQRRRAKEQAKTERRSRKANKSGGSWRCCRYTVWLKPRVGLWADTYIAYTSIDTKPTKYITAVKMVQISMPCLPHILNAFSLIDSVWSETKFSNWNLIVFEWIKWQKVIKGSTNEKKPSKEENLN